MSKDQMPPTTIRPFTPGDEAALLETWFTSWHSVGLDHPVVTRQHLADRLPQDLARRWNVTVAERDSVMLGFLAVALSEHRLDQLFIAPSAQRQGLGHRLFAVALQTMPNGFWLSTQPNNLRARAFYEQAGMQLDRIQPDPSGDKAIYRMLPPINQPGPSNTSAVER